MIENCLLLVALIHSFSATFFEIAYQAGPNLLSSANILKDEEKHFYEEQYIQPSKFRC